jgi:hypothetical protein
MGIKVIARLIRSEQRNFRDGTVTGSIQWDATAKKMKVQREGPADPS